MIVGVHFNVHIFSNGIRCTFLFVVDVDVVNCPLCGRHVSEPDKLLKNDFIHIEAYICDHCGTQFKKVYEFLSYPISDLVVVDTPPSFSGS